MSSMHLETVSCSLLLFCPPIPEFSEKVLAKPGVMGALEDKQKRGMEGVGMGVLEEEEF